MRATDPRTPCQTRRAAGFYLVESLLASVILALAVLAITMALSASYQQAAVMQEDAAMQDLSAAVMEDLAALDYALVASHDGQSDTPTATVNGRSVSFARSIEIVYLDAGLSTTLVPGDLLRATVRVTAPSGRRYELARLFSRIEMTR